MIYQSIHRSVCRLVVYLSCEPILEDGDLLGDRRRVLARGVDAAHALALLPDPFAHGLLGLQGWCQRLAGVQVCRAAGLGVTSICRSSSSTRRFSSSTLRVYASLASCILEICACTDTSSGHTTVITIRGTTVITIRSSRRRRRQEVDAAAAVGVAALACADTLWPGVLERLLSTSSSSR